MALIYLQNKTCLNCKKFRLEDPHSGVCRQDKTVEHYPMKGKDDTCEKWLDAGQQYHIRLGWIKTTLKKEEDEKGEN